MEENPQKKNKKTLDLSSGRKKSVWSCHGKEIVKCQPPSQLLCT